MRQKLEDGAKRFAPSTAEKVVEGIALFYPPVGLGASVIRGILERALGRKRRRGSLPRDLVYDKNVVPRYAVELILDELKGSGISPVFTVDELDKISDDDLLLQFFESEQSFFQNKRSLIAISRTFGQVAKDISEMSIKRVTKDVSSFEGVTTADELRSILLPRLALGISGMTENYDGARKAAETVFTDEALTLLVNQEVTTHAMLARAYSSLKAAAEGENERVQASHVLRNGAEPYPLSQLGKRLLEELTKKRQDIKGLERSVGQKHWRQIRRLLDRFLNDGLIGETLERNFYITEKGEGVRRSIS